jgi:signal transduction histidine kinase
LRWYHLPAFFAIIGVLLFVHYYLHTGRAWLMWTIIVARSLILVINFSVQPNYNFSQIVSLRQISFLGEQVSVIAVATTRAPALWFAAASITLLLAYMTDAAIRRWEEGGADSRRKALAVFFGIGMPMSVAFVLNNFIILGFLKLPVTSLPWFLGALLPMAYEWGHDVILSRRARLQVAELQCLLAQAERVSLMGQLASSLAHELSQPLSATITNVEAGLLQLQGKRPDGEELRAILSDIGHDHRRAAEIIGQMRRLFKHRTIQMQSLGLDEVFEDVAALVHSETVSQKIDLRVVVRPGLPRVVADRVHLMQVLLNLVTNSIHALQVQPQDSRRLLVEARPAKTKGEVEVAIEDSGPGIPRDTADKLFKLFFTTKSEGTGIGLALCRTIIEAHGGRLWYDESRRDDGAVFCFTLRSAPNVTEVAATSIPQGTMRDGEAQQAPA